MSGHKTMRAILGFIIMATSANYVVLTGELAGLIVTGLGYLIIRGVR